MRSLHIKKRRIIHRFYFLSGTACFKLRSVNCNSEQRPPPPDEQLSEQPLCNSSHVIAGLIPAACIPKTKKTKNTCAEKSEQDQTTAAECSGTGKGKKTIKPFICRRGLFQETQQSSDWLSCVIQDLIRVFSTGPNLAAVGESKLTGVRSNCCDVYRGFL